MIEIDEHTLSGLLLLFSYFGLLGSRYAWLYVSEIASPGVSRLFRFGYLANAALFLMNAALSLALIAMGGV